MELPLPFKLVVISESSDEATVAVVTFDAFHKARDNGLVETPRLYRFLRRAMHNWITMTKEGAAFWESTSEDANLGDLVTEFNGRLPPPVAVAFAAAGIVNFHVECHSCEGKQSWGYDDVISIRDGDDDDDIDAADDADMFSDSDEDEDDDYA